MSDGHFHVHGPHDHEVEHQAHAGDSFAGTHRRHDRDPRHDRRADELQGGATQNDALLFKNEAAIRKTEASDQWNFYQAKSNKQNLAELGATLDHRRGRGAVSGRGEALQRREEGHPEEGRELEKAAVEAQRAQRGVDARASPVGAGDDADPGRDRARRDHAADAQASGCSGASTAPPWAADCWRRWRRCTSDDAPHRHARLPDADVDADAAR